MVGGRVKPFFFGFCQAVKKSRVKSRQKTQETLHRVQQLKTENDQLEEKIKLLSKELSFLKDLFLAHAGEPTLPVRSTVSTTEGTCRLPFNIYYIRRSVYGAIAFRILVSSI
ncbi:hypothetical protein AAG570_007512 [Ranatra chinensis]|uniref:BZIP domain-containing protein n=1 Tax=Ranatra chinensis TaxID=642074 RepID=A0ABD0XX77_9HEMI